VFQRRSSSMLWLHDGRWGGAFHQHGDVVAPP